ncbi:DUF6167 family protein [uncultured Tessaracoccus sp.]|uniref:DUF6167 family protein n=1 Tax=uncultured Tessaracoccus sp. TaxID=905023 RepID=UPI0025EC4EBB|nr:DUF6167 family protein [uncultured Tessaracoccus sp.]
MKGTFWFTAGAAAATYVMLKGRKLYRQYVPEALRREIDARAGETAVDLGRFTATFDAARAEREAELRRELNLPED